MNKAKVIPVVLLAAVLFSFTCDDNPVTPGGEKKVYGTLWILIDQSQNPKTTKILGKFNNGPMPAAPWDTVMTSGECNLVTPKNVKCQDCGSGHVCVADNNCQAEPEGVTVGAITIEGYKNRDSAMTSTMEPLNGNYQPSGNYRPAYPGLAEGSMITLKASGNDSVAGFTLSAKSISPLVIFDDTLEMNPGEAIDLKWQAAAVPTNSSILVSIDLSYHGGTSAKVESKCDDDGQLTIPADILDRLQTYPIYGNPKLEITRKSEGTDLSTGAKLVLESYALIWLKIPGVVSCSDEMPCPTGYDCINMRCVEAR